MLSVRNHRSAVPHAAVLAAAALSAVPFAAVHADTGCVDYALSPRLMGVADTPGSAVDVAFSGGYAYVVDNSNGLQVVDVSDPSAPVITRTTLLSGTGTHIAVDGTLGFVTITGGVQTLDLTQPHQPIPRGIAALTGTEQDIVAMGNIAYVAVGGGFDIVDASVPGSPVVAATITTRSASALGISVDRLATTAGNNVSLYDRSSPLAPAFLGEASLPVNPVTQMREFRSPVPLGNTVLVVDNLTTCLGSVPWFCWIDAAVEAWDFAVPSAPVLAGSLAVEDEGHELVVSGNRAYHRGVDNGLWTIDVTNPLAPAVLHHFRTPTASGGMVVFAGPDGAVVGSAEAATGLRLYGIANPDEPSWAGGMTTHVTTYDVAVNGDRAYTLGYYDDNSPFPPGPSQYAELRTYLASDPTALVPLTVLTSATGQTWGSALAFAGDQLYMTDGVWFQRCEVSPVSGLPATPQTITTVTGSVSDLEAAGAYLLVAQGGGGLTVLDTPATGDPSIVLNIPSYTVSEIAVNGAAGLTRSGSTVRTLDLTDPAAAQFQGSVTTSFSPTWIATGAAVAAAGTGTTIEILDRSDPVNPVSASTVTVPLTTKAGALSDGFLYVSLNGGGVWVYDVSVPSAPGLIGGLPTDAARTVRVRDGYAWVCEGGNLSALPLACGAVGVAAAVTSPPSAAAVFPNPFRTATTVRLSRPARGIGSVRVHDVAGRVVRHLRAPDADRPDVRWNGRDDAGRPVAPGVYFLRAESRNGAETARMVRIR